MFHSITEPIYAHTTRALGHTGTYLVLSLFDEIDNTKPGDVIGRR